LLAALGALMLVVTFTPVDRIVLGWLAGEWGDSRGDTLIVLGGDSTGDGIIGESSYWRTVYAVRFWRAGGFRRVILSGSIGITGPMRRYMLFEGVPDNVITVESQSQNTHENAVNVSRIVGPADGRLVLLTSDFHMWRAARVFRKQGLSIQTIPIPDARKRETLLLQRWPVFLGILFETAKIVYYATLGWI
jgi:uncharacterized SAM-binding protein YcdF (DUF218 family)